MNNIKTKALLTVLYYVAISILTNNAINFFGDYPSVIEDNLEFFKSFLKSGLNFTSDPARQYILYLFVMQCLIIRPIYKIEKILKFNIFLTFILEMLFILLALCWEIIANKEIEFIQLFGSANNMEKFFPEEVDDFFYSASWSFFFLIYAFCYLFAIISKYPKVPKNVFPIFQRIIDSIHFWFWRESSQNRINKNRG